MPSTLRETNHRIAPLAFALIVVMAGAGCAAGTSDSPDPSVSEIAMPARDPALAARVPAAIRARGSLVIAKSAGHPPNGYFDEANRLVGWEVDLGRAVAAKLGLAADFQVVEFTAIIPGLRSGRYDVGMSGLFDTLERQRVVNFVDYFRSGTSLIIRKGNPDGLTGVGDLCGHAVAVETGTSSVDIAAKQSEACVAAGRRPLEVQNFTAQTQVALQVQSGRAAAGINDHAVALYLAKQARGKIEAVGSPADQRTPYGFAVDKGATELLEVVHAAMASLMADGTYAAILAKWGLQDGAIPAPVINGGTR